MRRLLLALLLFAAPALGQEKFSATETVYSGGNTKITRFGFSSGTGTNNAGAARFGFPAGTVALYQLGNAKEAIRGGYDLNGTTQTLSQAAAPATESDYPFWIYCCFKKTSGASSGTILVLRDADASTYLGFGITSTGSGLGQVFAGEGATTTSANTATAITAGKWHYAVVVFTSASSRSFYSDFDTTGVTDTTTVSCVGIDRLLIGGFTSANFAGSVALTEVFRGAGPSADQRTAMYAGQDPERVYGSPAYAKWTLDNSLDDSGSSGSFDLTAAGSPTAQSYLIVARDLSGGGYHVKATTAAPTYSTSIGNGQGGGVFTAASSQFLVSATPPVSVAPLQMYAVAQLDNVTANGVVACITDTAGTADYWQLAFSGNVANDPTRFVCTDASVATSDVNSYSANTNYLLYGNETSATSRYHERNGVAGATETTNLSPDGVDRLSIGVRADSTPAGYMDGEVHFVLLLNVSSTADQPSIERHLSTAYALGF